MSYGIEWVGTGWRRAVVVERRWFEPDRVTEVELRVTEVELREDITYVRPRELWYHVGTDVMVDGAYTTESFAHRGLQRKLQEARGREIERLSQSMRADEHRAREAKRAGAWRERRDLPRASVVVAIASTPFQPSPFQPGDLVGVSTSSAASESAGTIYAVARVEATARGTTLEIRRLPWWRRLYRWIHRLGLDLGAP